jgi:hypothetical protein
MAIIKGDLGATGILKDAIRAANKLPIGNLLLALGPTTPLSLQPPTGSRILKDAINASKDLEIGNMLLALGPTTPISLQPPSGTKILWVTFTDGQNLLNGPRVTIVPPTHLTDLSLNLEKLSKTRTSRIPLIVGDFLDNVLSVSSSSAGLYSFLCKLFTRIRTNGQTAFLLATEDMHDSKKTAILKRFADVVIEYSTIQDVATHRFEARILDHVQTHYTIWDSSESPAYDGHRFLGGNISNLGRHKPYIQESVQLRL